MIVWCDTETSGLNPREGHLLEVALLVTDDDLVEKTAFSVVCKPVGVEIDAVPMDPYVRDMHTKNGLLDEVRVSGVRRHEAELMLVAFVEGAFKDREQRTIFVSKTEAALRLSEHMPALEEMFSYRSVDVSSITELAKRWAPFIYENRPKAEAGAAHRALADIRESVEYLRYYRRTGFLNTNHRGGGEL